MGRDGSTTGWECTWSTTWSACSCASSRRSELTAGGTDAGEIRIGISTCLLGERVRFDGGHKRDSFLTETLARFVRFVPVCPEVEIGLGTPRESLRLVRAEGGPRLVAPRSGTDHTAAMERHSRRRAADLARQELCGFVLKKDSPTCGLERVRLYDRNDVPSRVGRGLFASALLERMPQLPVEEEGRLKDPRLRENFFERVFAYRRLRGFFAPRWRLGDLVAFHASEKMLLQAHDLPAYRALGRIVAEGKGRPRSELAAEYRERFMEALSRIATVRKHANVLQHILGFFKRSLGAAERSELAALIEDYRHGLIPLVVPITLIRHHARMQGIEYLLGQSYLDPHPKELMLRNHV